MSHTYTMTVRKYIPSRLYGFVHSLEGEGFFHLGYFYCPFAPVDEAPIPPIIGEEVETSFAESLPAISDAGGSGNAPRASRVTRRHPPVRLEGTVEAFDAERGFGFITGEDGSSFYLHRSEVLEGRIPFVGDKVCFYLGHSRGKPRACYIDVLGRED